MVADLVRHVAGERADVHSIMGEGVDPHLFKPTGTDIGLMMRADLIVYSGLHLEGAMQSAFEKAAAAGRQAIAITAGLPQDVLRTSAKFAGHPDPHVWHDVSLWSQCLDEAVKVLSARLPDHADEFQSNAAAYRQELAGLDRYARECIATVPAERRYLVTAHDAFSYFSRTYQIEEKSVQGITTDSEPGVQDISDLVKFLVEHKIPALFVEATVNEANLRAVIEGARQKGWEVKVGGMLYSDSMGAPGTYAGTYEGMIDHNVTTITRALGGTAPEKGRLGKLSP
jgi:manganese/zinc/iron transport system substrate-binding protein